MKLVDEKSRPHIGKATDGNDVLTKPSLRQALPQQSGFNLLDYPLFRRIIQSRLYPGVLQAVTVLVFAVIVYYLLAGPSVAHLNFGTAMTWVLWWPLIPLFFLVLGRFWCAICPFATISDAVQKIVGHNRPVPAFLKKYGIWVIDAIFILITWSDHIFGIVESPRGSGVLLLGLILGVVTIGSFFERRTWCRYLCFLGGLSGNYSRAGATELRATPSKCAKCNVQACYRGSDKAPGCPMFEFPRAMDTNARCNLCGYCVKSCPNDSIRITPRVPTRELWSIRKPKFEESFLACVIMGVVFVQNVTMLGIWKDILAWLEGITGTDSYFVSFTIAFAVAMALPIAALFGASYLSNLTGKRGILATFTIFGYALIPLDLAGHLAHNLFHLLAEGKNILYTGLSLFGIASQGSAALMDSATIQVLQYLLVLAGVVGSAYTAYRISGSRPGEARGAAAWIPIAVLVVVLGIVNLVLFYLPMEMRM
jgi:polyferredoxin